MNEQRPRFAVPGGLFVDPPSLAHVAAFRLGPLVVEPGLRRIIGASGHTATLEPLGMQVLIALAETPGKPCSRDDLVTRCWGRRIVGDDAVNRVISRLRRDLAAMGQGTVAIETIPKVGYRLQVKGDDTAGSGDTDLRGTVVPGPSRASRPIKAGLAVGATLAVAGLAFAWRQPAAALPVAIAVEASSSNADAEATRFAGDVTTDLARFLGAATRVNFVETDAAKAAPDLLIRVSVRRDGSQLTSRVRLVQTSTSAVVWSQDFRDATGSGALLRERTASGIADVVRCGLERLAGELDDPVNVRLYFGACDAAETHDWPRARSLAQQLVDLKPKASSGWACLALTTINEAGGDPRQMDAAATRAVAYAQRALSIDPTSGLAYQALGSALSAQGQSPLDVLEKGIAADPDHAGLQSRYSVALASAGYTRAAVEPALRAVALGPSEIGMNMNAVLLLLDAGRNAEARSRTAELVRLWSDSPQVQVLQAYLLYLEPNAQDALASFRRHPPPDPQFAAMLAPELEWRANPATFKWSRFDEMARQQFAVDPANATILAMLAMRMHDKRRATEWLMKGPARYGNGEWTPLFGPETAEMRRDPRFFAKMKAVGLVDLWRKRGQWPDFCSDPALAYDCKSEAARLAGAGRT
jgi:DNA-binding winged helix-turn-helix (wHTH) protein